jgi:hypothetical protein
MRFVGGSVSEFEFVFVFEGERRVRGRRACSRETGVFD